MERVETNTNQPLRKKYFVNADFILSRRKNVEVPDVKPADRIIEGSRVRLAPRTRTLGAEKGQTGEGRMNVHVIKDGDRIRQVQIACPCGRRAELDCRYEAEGATLPGAPAGQAGG